jgi:phospholipid/cholesterol/gamma-HCH transport system substrate-binding protein
MKYSNELKVGIVAILSAIGLYVGVRFLQNLPATGSTYEIVTYFKQVEGLLETTPVKVKGVEIGKVTKIEYKYDKDEVEVRMQIKSDFEIPTQSKISFEGIGAVGGVRLEIWPGNPKNAKMKDGGFIEPINKPELLANLSNKATSITSKIDSVGLAANGLMSDFSRMVNAPDGDVKIMATNTNRMISSLNQTAQTLQSLIQAQQSTLAQIMGNANAATEGAKSAMNGASSVMSNANTVVSNVNNATTDIRRFTNVQKDSVALALQNLNRLLESTRLTIQDLNVTTTNLGVVSTKIKNGEGSIGQLMNDQSKLYNRIDSLSIKMNGIMTDLKANPRKYLRGLVKIF